MWGARDRGAVGGGGQYTCGGHVYHILFFIYDAFAPLTGTDRIATARVSAHCNHVNYHFDWNLNFNMTMIWFITSNPPPPPHNHIIYNTLLAMVYNYSSANRSKLMCFFSVFFCLSQKVVAQKCQWRPSPRRCGSRSVLQVSVPRK